MTLRADLRVTVGDLRLSAQLQAATDSVTALLGPNGAGKTTLLRALAGLVPLRSGRIELDGTVWEDTAAGVAVPPERRGVAMVFQDLRLFAHLSARDNVAYGLRATGLARTAAQRRATEWLDRVGLAGAETRRPGELSGGQRQRVALARALCTEPRLLLLDEPLASVDASSRRELRRLISDQIRELNAVRILVTHDPVEAAALADHVVIVEDGGVVQEGSYPQIAARPRSEWVARLAGLNLLRGEASPGCLELPGGIRIAAVTQLKGPALAVIHPRAVTLHRAFPSGSARNVLSGRVLHVEKLGEIRRVEVKGPIGLIVEVTSSASEEFGLVRGSEVFLAFKATEIDVYPI